MPTIIPLPPLSPPPSPQLKAQLITPLLPRSARKKRSRRLKGVKELLQCSPGDGAPSPSALIGEDEVDEDSAEYLFSAFLYNLRSLGALPQASKTVDDTCCHGRMSNHEVGNAVRDWTKFGKGRERLGEDHLTCSMVCCKVRRAMYMDKVGYGSAVLQLVPVRVHVHKTLVDHILPAFDYELELLEHYDDVTSSSFICAPKLVRAFMPKFFASIGKRMHSLYTLNHPYGRGTPADLASNSAIMDDDTWRKWTGCPQAMLGQKCNPEDYRARVWLLDGYAEVSFSAECEPDLINVNPPINSSKGKRRAM